MMTFYVYRHIRLDSGTPFYIGKGKNGRAYEKAKRNNYWKKIINKVGYRIEIIKAGMEEKDAFALEKVLISLYKQYGLCEANLTDGGEGNSGYKFTKKQRESQSKRMMGHIVTIETRRKISKKLTGKSLSEETKQKLSDILTGRVMSEETKKKMSIAQKGKKLTKDHKDKLSKAHTGKVISKDTRKKVSVAHKKIYESIERRNENAIRGGGRPFLVWKVEVERYGRHKIKDINKIEFIGEWVNIRECGRNLGIDRQGVSKCLNGHIKTYYNYYFEYKE